MKKWRKIISRIVYCTRICLYNKWRHKFVHPALIFCVSFTIIPNFLTSYKRGRQVTQRRHRVPTQSESNKYDIPWLSWFLSGLYSTCFSCFIKGAVSRGFRHFFISWIEAIWTPDTQAKMVLFKSLFPHIYLWKIRLRPVLACTESDTAQANTAWSQTLRRLTLRRVKNWNVCKSKIG